MDVPTLLCTASYEDVFYELYAVGWEALGELPQPSGCALQISLHGLRVIVDRRAVLPVRTILSE